MRVLITILIIVVIFCVLVYDCQIKENFAQEETNIYNKHPETLNLSNFTSYFLPQQYKSPPNNDPKIYQKIKGGIMDLYFKFFSKFYSNNSYLLTEDDEESSKNILISNLAIVKEFGKLEKISKSQIANTGNITTLQSETITLKKFISVPLEKLLTNYVVIYHKNMDFDIYDNNDFYIADTKGNLLFSFNSGEGEENTFKDTILENLTKKISNIFSNPTGEGEIYKFVILNEDIQEKFKLNFEINLATDKNSITYSWKIEEVTKPDSSIINFENIYNQINREIHNLNRLEPSYMGMMDPDANNIKNITDTENSIIKNNLSSFNNICMEAQNEMINGEYVSCDSNSGNLYTAIKYFTNYDEIKKNIDDEVLKIKNFSAMEIQDYYLIISFYHNFYYDRYKENTHQKIIKFIISIFNKIAENNSNTDLQPPEIRNNNEGSNVTTDGGQDGTSSGYGGGAINNLVLKLNSNSVEVLPQFMGPEKIPEKFKGEVRKLITKYQNETEDLFIEDKTENENETENNLTASSNNTGISYQRDSFKIIFKKGELESTDHAVEKIDAALKGLTETTKDGTG